MNETKKRTLFLGLAVGAALSFAAIEASGKKKGMSLEEMEKSQKYLNDRFMSMRKKTKSQLYNPKKYQQVETQPQTIENPKFESVYFETHAEQQKILDEWKKIKNASEQKNEVEKTKKTPEQTRKIKTLNITKNAANLGSIGFSIGFIGKGIYDGLQKNSNNTIKPKNFINPWTIAGAGSSLASIVYHILIRPKLKKKINKLSKPNEQENYTNEQESPENNLLVSILTLSPSEKEEAKTDNAKTNDRELFYKLIKDPEIENFPFLKTEVTKKIQSLDDNNDDDSDSDYESESEEEGEEVEIELDGEEEETIKVKWNDKAK